MATDDLAHEESGSEKGHDLDRPDPMLTVIVKAINSYKHERVVEGQPITLFVNGIVVTGEIVPAWQWSAEQAKSDDEDDLMFMFAEALKAKPDDDDLDPEFIHLAKASFILWPQPTQGSMHWRGRLSHVSGWVLGRMSIGQGVR